MAKIDFKQFKNEAILERELISNHICQDFRQNHSLFEDWFSNNYFIQKCDELGKNQEKKLIDTIEFDFEFIFNLVKELYLLQIQISLLQRDLIIFIKDNNSNIRSYRTEKNPITKLPDIFYSELTEISFDQELFESSFAQSLKNLIESERFSRYQKLYFNNRLFPFLTPDQAELFYFIFQYILENFRGKVSLSEEEIIIPSLEVEEFRTFLQKKFSQKEVDWFLKNMIFRNAQKSCPFNLFNYQDNDNSIIIPYYSLQLLHTGLYKYMKIPQLGDDQNFKGSYFEDSIYNLLTGFDLNLTSPINGSKLIRIPNPEKTNEEIMDVMGYNQSVIVLIESKSWDTPILESLEEELEKFRLKCEYVINKVEKFGISKIDREVIRIFFTPFPPLEEWKGIHLFPATLSIYNYLSHKIKLKQPEFLPEDPKIVQLIESMTDYMPYSKDLHEFDPNIPENRFRVQDMQVVTYDDYEITLTAFNPHGEGLKIHCGISKKMHAMLTQHSISEGSYIKGVFANILGLWNYIQMMHFKPTVYDPLFLKIIDLYRDDSQIIFEIYRVFKKYSLDLIKLIGCCERKNENIYWAIGSVLSMDKSGQSIIQCDCGEIMSFDPDLYEKFKTTYPNDAKKCKLCDAEHDEKIKNVIGQNFIRLTHKITDFDVKKMQFHKNPLPDPGLLTSAPESTKRPKSKKELRARIKGKTTVS